MTDPRKLSRFVAIRERLEGLKKAELVEARTVLRAAEARESAAAEAMNNAIRFLIDQDGVEGFELMHRASLVSFEREAHKQAVRALHAQQEAEQTAVDAAIEARRDVRVVEHLRDKALAERAKRVEKFEQNEQDERASRTSAPGEDA